MLKYILRISTFQSEKSALSAHLLTLRRGVIFLIAPCGHVSTFTSFAIKCPPRQLRPVSLQYRRPFLPFVSVSLSREFPSLIIPLATPQRALPDPATRCAFAASLLLRFPLLTETSELNYSTLPSPLPRRSNTYRKASGRGTPRSNRLFSVQASLTGNAHHRNTVHYRLVLRHAVGFMAVIPFTFECTCTSPVERASGNRGSDFLFRSEHSSTGSTSIAGSN